jgi:hypothetical protein
MSNRLIACITLRGGAFGGGAPFGILASAGDIRRVGWIGWDEGEGGVDADGSAIADYECSED